MNDIKITFIVGSNNPNSFTYYTVVNLINTLNKENGKKINCSYLFDVVFLKEYSLEVCLGCSKCFIWGTCPLDNKDIFKIIKNKLFKTNVIIWASPVYVGFISGTMKNFIDRSAASCHLMNYAGRVGFNIVTTNFSGGEYSIDYLRNIQLCFGIKNLNNFVIKRNEADFKKKIDTISKKITNDISNNFGYSNEILDSNFEQLKRIYTTYSYNEIINKNEHVYWNKMYSLGINSFEEYALQMLKNNGKLL